MAAALIPATRAEALQALRDFADGPVLRYAYRRNHIGEGHPGVSRLSAAVAHRLITEAEIVRAVLQIHKPAAVEKFPHPLAAAVVEGEGLPAVPAGLDVSAIAGTVARGLGRLLLRFDEPGDGTVAVSETRIPGLSRHVTVAASHSGQLFSPATVEAAVSLLAGAPQGCGKGL